VGTSKAEKATGGLRIDCASISAMIHFTIPGELCDLNAYIEAERAHKNKAAKIKEEETYRCAMEASVARVQEVPEGMYPVIVHLTWYTKDKRKDVDNVTFGKKFILDGLVDAFIIENDSRKYVRMVQDQDVLVDKKNPRVEVSIFPA
jgi:hypothetical protein